MSEKMLSEAKENENHDKHLIWRALQQQLMV